MIRVIDRVTDEARRRPERQSTDYIFLHRVLWPQGAKEWDTHNLEHDARSVAEYYRLYTPQTVGNKAPWCPYHFVIGFEGDIEQCYPKGKKAKHAANLNNSSLGIALLGDFRLEPPTEDQMDSLHELLNFLAGPCGCYYEARIVGHTMGLTEATGDRDKICPGSLLDLSKLREGMRSIAALEAIHALRLRGVVF